MNHEARLIELETKAAHQDQAILDLSEEIYRQQQQLALLRDQCRHLLSRLESLAPADQRQRDPADDVPPHY
ncbi:MAG: SlyX family protein [Gammaproteobacteria bacterium]